MPLTIAWREIALRLFFTVLAGALIGWNRGEHGHPAGLRTTILVCLAASVSMSEANLLLGTRGKPEDSFAVLDLARFPLGILSGIGFIGAGAIIRRDNLVQGVTTAATLWFVTMVGLCIGGGQIGIGVVSTLLGYGVLSLLKKLEARLPVDRQATVELTVEADSGAPEAWAERLAGEGYRVVRNAASSSSEPPRRHIRYQLTWRAGEPARAR
jgi:putative Mg2+ transporter-C (MgtC) family protein